MKLTLADTKFLKESVNIISELVTEVRFDVKKDAFELVAMDPANVAMVVYRLFSSAFVEYKTSEESITINLNDLKQVFRRIKPADTLTLEEKDSKLLVTLKGTSKREFSLPLIDLEEKEQKVPELSFTATITTQSSVLSDAVEDVDIIGESVALVAENDLLKISSSNDLSKADIEVVADEDTKISAEEKTTSKYSIEYLKKMITASKLCDDVTIKFSNNYPLQLEYKLVDKMSLQFILAPRVDND